MDRRVRFGALNRKTAKLTRHPQTVLKFISEDSAKGRCEQISNLNAGHIVRSHKLRITQYFA